MNRRELLDPATVEIWVKVHPRWEVQDGRLHGHFGVSFTRGAEIVGRIAEVAEEMDHHPDLHLRYGNLDVQTWTHDRGGITGWDLDLADRIDEIVG